MGIGSASDQKNFFSVQFNRFSKSLFISVVPYIYHLYYIPIYIILFTIAL